MTRKELLKFVRDEFAVSPEYLWEKTPNFAVLRKEKSKKWFGIVMDIPHSKLQISNTLTNTSMVTTNLSPKIINSNSSNEIIDVLNLKAPKDLVAILTYTKGIYPAYHMNKKSWLSIVLGEADDELIKDLLIQSFELV